MGRRENKKKTTNPPPHRKKKTRILGGLGPAGILLWSVFGKFLWKSLNYGKAGKHQKNPPSPTTERIRKRHESSADWGPPAIAYIITIGVWKIPFETVIPNKKKKSFAKTFSVRTKRTADAYIITAILYPSVSLNTHKKKKIYR